ncbi:MAG: hypothetical protein VXZ96_17230 [Myxococcota bacterium]|nr:hypothetical protein [Myxococcota bacterium]
MFQPVYDILTAVQQPHFKKCVFFCSLFAFVPAIPALLSGGLIGFEGAEIYGHAWSYWWRIEAFPDWPNGTDLAHGTQVWPSIDPLPSLFCVLIGQLVGPLWATNAWLLVGRFVLAIGGWKLAQTTNGRPVAGAFLASFWPPILGVQYSGLTEDFGLGLVLIAFASLMSPIQKNRLRGALLLALVPWCGLVLGWYTALAAVCLGCALWWNSSAKVKKEWLILGCISILIGGLSGLPHWVRLGGIGHRLGEFQYVYEPMWSLNPFKYIDVASLFVPNRPDFDGFIMRLHPGYFGISCLFVACLGFFRQMGWWLLLGLFVGISLGPQLVWFGEPTGWYNPLFYLIEKLPGFSLMNHLGRALLLASVPLIVLVARGTKNNLLFGAVILDLLFLAPLSPILTNALSDQSVTLQGLSELPDGDVLILPVSGPNIHPQKPLWEQRFHERKIWLSPNRLGLPPALQAIPAIRQLSDNPSSFSIEDETFPCFIAAVLVRSYFAPPYVEALGPPMFKDDHFLLWSRRQLSPQTKCAI